MKESGRQTVKSNPNEKAERETGKQTGREQDDTKKAKSHKGRKGTLRLTREKGHERLRNSREGHRRKSIKSIDKKKE